MDLLHDTNLNIIFRSFVVYLFIIVAFRLFGKKELAQLSVIDLVFILLISNSVQNAMVGPDSSLTGGLIAAGTLFVVNYSLKFILYKFPQITKLIQGGPLMLIYRGRLNTKNMSKAKITLAEMQESIREHGVAGVENVDLAILETDGNISILSNEFKHHTIKKRRIHKSFLQKNE
jgi:uncharacterized membrane protein YcaP (DUF421 family)